TCLIVDLHQLDESSRGGMVRFLCGVSYGLDGRSDRINELTYVFAPRQYDLPHVDAPRSVGEDPLPAFALPL
ncbi:MAG: cell division protein SepF, partial [Armatimonadetes bacterium]|nr:cell division protein SepF [Armatimonadota bacterium]